MTLSSDGTAERDMSSKPQDITWIGLAGELLARRDLKPAVRAQLKQALEVGDPDVAGARVKALLASAVAERAADARTDGAAPQSEGEARRARALVSHALKQLDQSSDGLDPRLERFLSTALSSYAAAYRSAGEPKGLEAPADLVGSTLDSLRSKHAMARRARVGVLTPAEVQEIAAGTRRLADTATVASSGDIERDLDAWREASHTPSERMERLREGSLGDGEYVLALIEPGPTGERVAVHPLTGAGAPSARPVAQFAAPVSAEPVSMVRLMVEPVVTQAAPTGVRAPVLVAAEPADVSNQLQAAIAINEARIALYAQTLRGRSDLRGAARLAAERRLERMEQETAALASGSPDAATLGRFLTQWGKELSRDLASLRTRLAPPTSDGFSRGLSALSRMGALQQRLSDLDRAVAGQPDVDGYTGLGGERLLLRPDSPAESIFDTLRGATVAAAGARSEGRSAVGEGLSTDVTLRAAGRSAVPTGRRQRALDAVMRAGQRLRQALTTAAQGTQAGLAIDSGPRPLLRPQGMPSVIRADMRSPLLRNVLLPAMQQVSGPSKALARTAQRSASSGSTWSPEQLLGTILGSEAIRIIEERPELARSLLGQMGDLAGRLERSDKPPSKGAIRRAGQEMRERVSMITAATDDESDDHGAAANEATDAVGAAAGFAPAGVPATLEEATSMASQTISDVAGDLAQEGQALSSALKDRIGPFVDWGDDMQLYSGPVASAALDEMGAMGASIGRDVYVHQRVMQRGGVEAAAVVGHEAVHAQRSRLGQGSIETEEAEAYRVEAEIRSSFTLGELAKEHKPEVPGKGENDPQAEAEEAGRRDIVAKDLLDLVAIRLEEEVERTAIKRGGLLR